MKSVRETFVAKAALGVTEIADVATVWLTTVNVSVRETFSGRKRLLYRELNVSDLSHFSKSTRNTAMGM